MSDKNNPISGKALPVSPQFNEHSSKTTGSDTPTTPPIVSPVILEAIRRHTEKLNYEMTTKLGRLQQEQIADRVAAKDHAAHRVDPDNFSGDNAPQKLVSKEDVRQQTKGILTNESEKGKGL
ncbi:hypothetical protein ACO0LM_22345 [Undibacterium sp. Di26W]|uniref:hypothetical protein n=1 Tax=Undibacterium sp. Di26W TaxID=3413035 RepID=UPI003BF1D68C